MTSDGNIMWSGIEVWGNSNEPQYPYNGTYKQGVLELKNGAVIENAVCAVELWRPSSQVRPRHGLMSSINCRKNIMMP